VLWVIQYRHEEERGGGSIKKENTMQTDPDPCALLVLHEQDRMNGEVKKMVD